jgi:hypothetical protein
VGFPWSKCRSATGPYRLVARRPYRKARATGTSETTTRIKHAAVPGWCPMARTRCEVTYTLLDLLVVRKLELESPLQVFLSAADVLADLRERPPA